MVPMWLHAGLIHIAVNMNMLYQAGFQLERAAGGESGDLLSTVVESMGLVQ